MTPDHRSLLDRAQRFLSDDSRIDAVWLAGSLARGTGDALSDVDLLVCCAADQLDAVSHDIVRNAGTIAPVLLANSLVGGRVVSLVLEGWKRLDFSLTGREQLGLYDPGSHVSLFNRAGVKLTGQHRGTYQPSADAVLSLVREFLRVLGLAAVVAGREEYVVLMSGVEQLRGMTVNLMLEENAIAPWARGGHLSRRQLLTAAQYGALESLPPLSADRQSTLANHEALAALFLPLARRVAADAGAAWPEALEAATRAYLREQLGMTI